jgi:hypothetical protein
MGSARELVLRRFSLLDSNTGALLRTIHFLGDRFWVWRDGGSYHRESYGEIHKETRFLLERALRSHQGVVVGPFKPVPDHVNAVYACLRRLVEIKLKPDTPRPWFWIDPDGKPPAIEIKPYRNGLLHKPTDRMWPHTPEFFTEWCNTHNYDYEPDAGPADGMDYR